MEPHHTPRPRGRGIYLLPNLFTTGGLFAGFYAIIAATQGRFDEACMAIFIAAILDGVDGRVARLTNTQSEFGMQYDSLADLISFGLAPALVTYHWALSAMALEGPVPGKLGWIAAFLYAACAAIRLARFNSQVGQVDKRWFIGLASPAAAGLVASFVWTCHDNGFAGEELRYLALGVAVAAALLMVSRLRSCLPSAWCTHCPVPRTRCGGACAGCRRSRREHGGARPALDQRAARMAAGAGPRRVDAGSGRKRRARGGRAAFGWRGPGEGTASRQPCKTGFVRLIAAACAGAGRR